MRNSSHLKEEKSKRDFEELVNPWITAWNPRDYGVDAFIEITGSYNLKSDSFRNEGKFFTVQLKSTQSVKIINNFLHFSVPTKKIVQWHNSNIPLLLVIDDLTSNILYYLWIDDNLISELEKEPNWINQANKTLHIPKTNVLKKEILKSLRDYVINFKNATKKLILPETYFDVKSKCLDLISNFEVISNKFNFQSNVISLLSLKGKFEDSTYRIAISGPSRVGKSSLINAILERNLSPVGFFQTTGVPIQVISDVSEKMVVYYLNGTKEDFKLDPKTINQFASQDFNEDNYKKVKMVVIHAKNKHLEKGIAIYDIPGLDDPNENIYDYAWQTASKANIILYLLDGSTAQEGGFILRRDVKNHLNSLGTSSDKIFLVFNKIDSLSENVLIKLKERVLQDIKKIGLENQVSEKIYYISTKTQPRGNQKYDSLLSLENKLWTFIINNNKSGLANLSGVCKELISSINSFEEILRSRLFENDERTKMNLMLNQVQQRIPNLHEILFRQKNEVVSQLSIHTENIKNDILKTLENDLNNIPNTSSLPEENFIKDFLRNRVNSLVESCNSLYNQQFGYIKITADEWIELNLKQIREYLYHNTEQQVIDITEIESFNMPNFDYMSLIAPSIFVGIVSTLFAPATFFIGAISTLIGNVIFTSEVRRLKRINSIIKEVESIIDRIVPQIKIAFNNTIEAQTNEIYSYTHRKINAYTLDINNQMSRLNTDISQYDKDLYRDAFSDLNNLKENTNLLKKEIEEFTGRT
jgi:GTPase Era involved in 16S rRNA processing